MNFLFVNAYSYKNRGDSGIVIAMIKLLREIYPDCSIDIMSNFYSENKEFYKNYGVNSIEPIWNNLKGSMLKNYLKSIFFTLNLIIAPKFIPIIKNKNIKKYNLVISVGGGYLYSSKKGPLGYGLMNALFNMLYFKNHGIPVILFPQSIGPFNYKIDKKIVSKVLKSIDLVISREPISTSLLKNMGVKDNVIEIPDIAFLLEPKNIKENIIKQILGSDYKKYFKVGITVMDWLFARKGKTQKDIDLYLDKIAIALKNIQIKYKSKNIKIYIFPQVEVGEKDTDIYVSQQLFKKLKNKNINVKLVSLKNVYDPEEIVDLYSKMDIFIASRMHSAIFALAGGVPTIAFAYQPKTEGTFKLLGLKNFVLDIENFSPKEVVEIFSKNLSFYYKNNLFKEKIFSLKKKIRENIKRSILSLL